MGSHFLGTTQAADERHEALCVWQIKTKGFHAESKDTEFDAYVLDEESEDKLMDAMEPFMAKGGVIVDFHSCEFFPERWFDLVLVLRTDNTLLFDRLTKRCVTLRCGTPRLVGARLDTVLVCGAA